MIKYGAGTVMQMLELLQALRLPEETAGGFEHNFDKSAASCCGVPEYMTMDFVRKYYPWVGGSSEHYAGFERVAAKVAESEALQLYAHHAHLALFVYHWDDSNYAKWPPLTAVLGDDAGLFDFMTAMSAIPLWCEAHKKMGVPEEYSKASAQWLKGTLQIYNSAHPGCYGIDRSQTHWLRFNILGRLFRIGRFEYMTDDLADWMPCVLRHKTTGKVVALCGDNWGLQADGMRSFLRADEAAMPFHTKLEITGETVKGTYISAAGHAVIDDERTLSLAEYDMVFKPGDFVPGMHIPGGGGMTVEKAYESWRQALEFFPKYLNRQVKGICCTSWIFNPSFERELPGSNLAKLMQEVYLFPERSWGRDGAFFIFGRSDGDFADYPRDNSVRQAFHRIIEAGETLHSGGMFILPAEINGGNGKNYRIEG